MDRAAGRLVDFVIGTGGSIIWEWGRERRFGGFKREKAGKIILGKIEYEVD